MPPGVSQQRRRAANQNKPADNDNNALSTDNPLSQLQQVVELEAGTSTGDPLQAPSSTPGQAIDGARMPIAPGAQYTSLRRITRRLPDDPEGVLDGVDTTNADLSWTAREDGDDINPATGEPWLFPKKRGRKVGSNLEDFKDEIEERTKNGQGCKAISEALVAKGVDTSSRAVARQRMKWGLRQRAPRRMTEQGIANIRKAHLEQAKRMANSDPVPVKRVRIRVMRKAEITRMTKEGMSTVDIAKNLEARGVKLKRGAATIERLRTVWGLVPDSQRNVNNVRQFCRNQAMRSQKEQFENIARELGIEDVNGWVKSKMEEEVALDARREHSYKLMGHLRPKQIDPGLLRRNAQHLQSLRNKNRTHPEGTQFEAPGYQQPAAMPGQHVAPSIPGETHDPATAEAIAEAAAIDAAEDAEQEENEFSLDEDELDSVAGDDDEGVNEPQGTTHKSANSQQSLPTAMDVDQSESMSPQAPPAAQSVDQAQSSSAPHTAATSSAFQPPPIAGPGHMSLANINAPPGSLPQLPPATPGQVMITTPYPNSQNDMGYRQDWERRLSESGQPNSNGNGHPGPGQQQGRPAEGYNAPRYPQSSFQPPSQGWLEPRSLGPMAPRAIAPKPPAARPLAPRPIAPRLPTIHTPHGEAEMMAKYGLFPYATFNKVPQKYLTPGGLITTEGYEYLPSAPPAPGLPGSVYQPAPSVQQLPQHATTMSPSYPQSHYLQNPQLLPPDVIMVPPPPPPKTSKIPAPPVVIAAEEMEKHKEEYKTIESYQKATQECLDFLDARANSRPLVDSLTGMPPSLKDVTNAKERLREAANAMLEFI